MREIKFRVWDTKNQRMVYEPYYFDVYHYSDENRVNQMTHRYYEDWRSLEDGRGYECEVMQYTGLKDKNGKDIFEGDRVKRRVTDFILEADHVDFNCDVVWNGWCYGLCVGGKQLWGLDPIVARECEIIGNIYEKPNI